MQSVFLEIGFFLSLALSLSFSLLKCPRFICFPSFLVSCLCVSSVPFTIILIVPLIASFLFLFHFTAMELENPKYQKKKEEEINTLSRRNKLNRIELKRSSFATLFPLRCRVTTSRVPANLGQFRKYRFNIAFHEVCMCSLGKSKSWRK